MIAAFIENHYPFLFDKQHGATTKSLLDGVERALSYEAPMYSDFVSPGYFRVFEKALAGVETLALSVFPEGAERGILCFHPPFYDRTLLVPPLALLESTLDERFEAIGHSDVLGALMHLGVERDQFGDILLGEGRCQVYCTETIAPVVVRELGQIKRSPTAFAPVPLTRALEVVEQGVVKRLTLSSLRVDAAIAAGFSLSRQKAQSLLESGSVKINHFVSNDQKRSLEEGDVVSVRHKGRLMVDRFAGTSKKGRIVLSVRLLKR